MDFNADDAEAMRQMWRDAHGLEAAPQPTAEHGLERLGSQLVNAPKRAVMAMGETIQGVGDFLSGKPQEQRGFERQTREDVGRNFMYRTRDVGQGNGALDTTTDVLAGGILPELPSLMIPGGIATKGARLLGATARLAPVVGDVAAGALSGLRDSGKEAGLQASEFGGMGLVGAALPRALRPLFRRGVEGAAGAGIGLAGQAIRGNDPFSQQSLIQAGAMGLMPAAMEASGGARRLFRRGTEPSETPISTPPSTADGIPSTWKLRRRVETPDGRFEHTFDTPEGQQVITHAEPLGGDVAESQLAVRNTGAEPVGEPYGLNPQPVKRKLLGRGEDWNNRGDIIEGEFYVEPPKQLGTRAGLPQGEPYDPARPPIPMGPEAPRRLLNRAEPPPSAGAEPHDIVPAIKVGDQTVTGNAGETHQDVLKRFVRDNPDRAVDALTTFDTKANPNFFVGPRGEPISRAQLHGRFGVTDSQELRDLQARSSGLRPLSREGGGIDPALLGGIAGATVGALSDPEHRERNAILGALGGGALGAAGRRILRRVGGAAGERAAAGQLGAKEGEGRSAAGFLRRTGEKYMKVGKSSTLDTIQEQARNTGSNVMEDVNIAAKKVLPVARNMTPAQWGAYDIYLGSDRSAGAQALMRAAGVPAEIVDFAINTSDVSARKLQEVHAEAQSDPVRKRLFQDTFGSYETQPYLAFEDPKAWQQRGVEPALYEQIVRENVADPRFAGMSERAIRDDLDAYIQNIHNFGGDFAKYNQEKGQRISQSLFTPRKLLRPSIQKLLGKIENPLQRQILTVHKLAKGAATAKAVTEVQKPDAVDDRGNRLGMLQSEREAAMQAAQAAGDTERFNFLRSNYEEVPEGMRGLGSLAEGQPRDKVMVQRQVADALNIGQGHQVITMDKSILAMLNSIPKAAHTIWNLSTHVHNMIQAPMMGMIAGVDPISLVVQNRRVAVNPRRMQWARDDGIVNAHMGANEFGHGGEVFEHVLNPTFWQQTKGVAKKVQDFSKKIYGLPDQWVRMAKYNQEIDAAIKDGLTERAARARATELTNRYTQNYSNVAPAVKLLRNVPLVNSFISYTAEMVRVLKNRAEDFLTDPMAKKFGPSASQKWKGAAAIVATLGVGSAIAALIQGSKLSEEDKEKLSKLLPILPPYMRGKTQPVYSMKDGQVSSYNLNPLLPAEDLVTTAKNILNGDWEAFWKNNPVAGSDRSPVLNILAEQISGKDAMGRPTRGLMRNIAQNALPGWVPGNYAAEKLAQGFSRNDKGELGVTNEQGRHETPGTAIASLFGFNASHLDSRRLFQRQQQNLQEQDRQAKTILNRTLRSDADQGAKEEAAEQYRETRRRIFQR